MGGELTAFVSPGVEVSIRVEPSDNGAIIQGTFVTVDSQGRSQSARRSAAVTSKDMSSDMARRKVQRTLVKWVQAYFPAPKRADAGKKKADATA